MSDATTDADPQAGTGGDGTDDATASPDAPQAGTKSTSTDASQEDATSKPDPRVQEANREAAATRRKLREAEARLAELEQASMSEAEKAVKRAEDAEARAAQAEAKLRDQQVRAAVYAESDKLKAVAPSDVYAIVRDDIAAAGDDADIPSIVKAALDERPHLIRQASSGAPANAGREQGSGDKTDAEMREWIYGRAGGGIFDAKRAAERGGGVQIPGGASQVERR